MAVQTLKLSIPEPIYQRARQAAEVLQRPVEDVIVDTLATTLPALDDAPAEMVSELAAMARLSDEALQGLANNVIAEERQELLDRLLDEQGRGVLDEAGQRELAALMAEYGRALLRRAKAVALFIARGRPVPALTPILYEL
jgi:hypothetical protein